MFHLDPDQVYRSTVLRELPWLEHGFGTRLASDWPTVDRLTTVRQVHSDKVVMARGQPGLAGEGDALITNQAATLLSVRTADCLPILIADVRTRAVAAVHAGWRGTVAGVGVKTVRAMKRQYGSRREDLRVVIGPGVGSCCFEVGPEVGLEFELLFPERDDLRTRTKVDLAEANRRQFIADGIAGDHISAAGLCTCCNPETFHSYRRDKEASGRMISAIGISALGIQS